MSKQRKCLLPAQNLFCSRGIKEAATGLLPQRILIPLGILMEWPQLWMDALICRCNDYPLNLWMMLAGFQLLLPADHPQHPPKLLHRAWCKYCCIADWASKAEIPLNPRSSCRIPLQRSICWPLRQPGDLCRNACARYILHQCFIVSHAALRAFMEAPGIWNKHLNGPQ